MAEHALSIPASGVVLRVSVNPGDSVHCNFTPENSLMELRGNDLTFASETGGSLVLTNFVQAVDSGEVTLDFGEFSVSGADIYASLTADFSTDFAPATPGAEMDLPLCSLAESAPIHLTDILDTGHTHSAPPLPAPVEIECSAHPVADPFLLSLVRLPSPEDDIPPHLRLDIPL